LSQKSDSLGWCLGPGKFGQNLTEACPHNDIRENPKANFFSKNKLQKMKSETRGTPKGLKS